MKEHALVYEEMSPISPEAAELALRSGEPDQISRALLRSALHGPDWDRAEGWAFDHLRHPDVWVRRNAATSLGHIARVHGRLALDRVVPALLRLLADPDVEPYADAALDDVETYLRVQRGDYHPPTGLASFSYEAASRTLEVVYGDGTVRVYSIPIEEISEVISFPHLNRYLGGQASAGR